MRSKIPPREDVPQRKRTEKAEPGPVPSLGELAAHVDWTWLVCDGCRRMTPVRFAPLIARYGADASSNGIRRAARCTECGHKGAGLQHPSWANTGWQAFPGKENARPGDRSGRDHEQSTRTNHGSPRTSRTPAPAAAERGENPDGSVLVHVSAENDGRRHLPAG